MEHYGERAKAWITDHDMKQKTLAKEFHISEAVLSHYLTGRNMISADILVKMSKYFHVTTDYLLGLTDEYEIPLHLNESEHTLIQRFRLLSPNQQELIFENIRLMQEQNNR